MPADVDSLTMTFEYIMEELPYNRELASEVGVDYANDGKSIRFNPVRVEVDSWIIDYERLHRNCDNPSQWDCKRCSENDGYDEETIAIRVKHNNHCYEFTRTRGHQLGHCWTNWYDNSPAK